jgi:hypothetical protein
MSEAEGGSAAETTVRALAMFPGFDDKNFQVLAKVGRCRLNLSKPGLKARLVSALETKLWWTGFKFWFQFNLRRYTKVFEVFGALAGKAPTFSKRDGAQAISVGRRRLKAADPPRVKSALAS